MMTMAMIRSQWRGVASTDPMTEKESTMPVYGKKSNPAKDLNFAGPNFGTNHSDVLSTELFLIAPLVDPIRRFIELKEAVREAIIDSKVSEADASLKASIRCEFFHYRRKPQFLINKELVEGNDILAEMIDSQHPDPCISIFVRYFRAAAAFIREAVPNIPDQEPEVGLVYPLS
jgi:hypothetical protein